MKLYLASDSWTRLTPGLSTLLPLFLLLATCSAGPKTTKPDDDPTEERTIQPTDEKDKVRFADARKALEAGNYEKAKETFRLIQAEEGSGEVAQLAELYVARADLGALEPKADGESGGGPPTGRNRALQMLQSMAAADDIDPRVRRAAQLYEGYVRLEREDEQRLSEIFSAYDEPIVGTAVLDGDRLALWPVLVEGLRRAERHAEAVVAACGLFEELEGRSRKIRRSREADVVAPAPPSKDAGGGRDKSKASGDQTGETVDGETGDRRSERFVELATFARNRGFDSAAELDDEALERRLEAESSFVRAVVGWTFLDRTLESGEVDAKKREKLDRRFAEVGADLNAIGAPTRVSELSIKLATIGGGKRLVVGAILPLSGQNSSIGQRALSGMLLAMRAFRKRGPPRVTLVIEDANAEPKAVWSHLAEIEPAAVVGPLDPSRAAKFAQGAQEREIPMVALTARRPTERADVAEPYIVRNFMDPVTEARAAANLAFHEFEDRRAAIVYPSVGYGETLQRAFDEEFRRLGGQIVETIAYDRSKSNYSHVADRLAGADVETVFIPDAGSKVAEVSAFLADRDIWGISPSAEKPTDDGRTYVHYLGTSLWYGPIVKRQAASYLQGAVIPTWFAPEFADNPTRQFARRFDVVFGRRPGNIEAFAYDNVRWIRRLMVEHGVQTARALRTTLLGGSPYEGATGRGSFDADGTLWRTVRFVTLSDEEFVPMELQVDIAPADQTETEGETTEPPVDEPDSGRDRQSP